MRNGYMTGYKKSAAMTLMGINVAVFIMQIIFGKYFESSLMLVSSDILSRPWILVTSMFLHAGLAHLFFNMYALLLFGPMVERVIGTKRFLYIYFLSGIVAGLGFSFVREILFGVPASALGASGAIMGIIGLVIMLFPDMMILLFFAIPMTMRTAGYLFVAYELIGIFINDGIANSAHLFGLAVGLIYGYYYVKKRLVHRNYYM